ncbi:MAG: hypothetical protein ACRYGR_08770 [Janthinobacterium lividum]
MDPDQVRILNGCELIIPLMLLNRDFFTRITGFEAKDIFKQGVENKPIFSSYSALIFKGYKRKNLSKDTREISSFFWYSLIGKVIDLPQDYWPYIKGSQITEVSFTRDKITSALAQKLGDSLQETKVNRVFLHVNKLGDKGVICLIKSLEGTCVKTLCIRSDRKITGEKFQERSSIFTKKNIGTFDLSYNNFNSNYLYNFGKIFINSRVHTLNLIGCDLNFTGAYDLIKGLQGTPVYTLNLSQNNIEDKDLNNDLKDLALALKDTNIRVTDFSNNKITLGGIHEFCDFFLTNIVEYKSYWFSFGKMDQENRIQLEKDLPNINFDRQDLKNNIPNNEIDLIRLFLFDRDIF